MYGSGAATGMEITAMARRPTLKVPTMGRPVCFVAAAGTATISTVRGTVVVLTAATKALAIAAASLDSACPYKFCFEVNETTGQRGDESTSR